MNVGHYTKAIVAIIAAGLGILVTAVSDNVISPLDLVNIGVALVTAFGVYAIPNFPEGPARLAKTGVALLGAAGQALVPILSAVNGWAEVTYSDYISVALAALAAVGIYALPNTPQFSTVNTNNVVVAAEAQGTTAEEVVSPSTAVLATVPEVDTHGKG